MPLNELVECAQAAQLRLELHLISRVSKPAFRVSHDSVCLTNAFDWDGDGSCLALVAPRPGLRLSERNQHLFTPFSRRPVGAWCQATSCASHVGVSKNILPGMPAAALIGLSVTAVRSHCSGLYVTQQHGCVMDNRIGEDDLAQCQTLKTIAI